MTKGYSAVQVKVRNGMWPLPTVLHKTLLTSTVATSNDAWGPSGTDMSEIASMTYNK